MRIPEVLLENFQRAVNLHEAAVPAIEVEKGPDGTATAEGGDATAPAAPAPAPRTEGDLPALSLKPAFWIKGVRIGWPFPEVLRPQRQMVVHLVTALQARRHVVLESPTGCVVAAPVEGHLRSGAVSARDVGASPNAIQSSFEHRPVADAELCSCCPYLQTVHTVRARARQSCVRR